MKCKYCNAEIEQDALFCPNCGKDLSKFDKCVKCGELLDQDAAFCPHCETEQPHEEVGEESSSKKWIWILCTVLGIVLIVGGIFFFSSNKGNFLNVNGAGEVNTDSVQMVEAISKRVTEIYNDVFSYNGEDYDSKYCSKSFLALVKEFDEAYEKANTGDLIGPDCDHWTAAQDCDNPSMSIISISKLSDKEATAKIHVKAFKDSDGTDVKLKMIYENGNWFIDDFIIGDYSERDEYQGGIDTLKDLANANKRISEAYIQKLKEHAKGEYMRCEYFLFDITKDGIPELWIVSGTCEADNKLTTYTHDLNMICQTSAMHSGFCKGNDYILQVSGQMGYSTWIKLYYDGNKIQEKTIFKEGPVEEYTKPKEKGITLTDYKDITPIKNAFK